MMEFGLVALWLGVYLALLAIGLPLAAALFPRLADRGAGVAIPLAAAILWLVGYWVGHVSLALATWAGVATLLVAVGVAVFVRRPAIDTRVAAETAGVFAVAFLFLVAVRAVDPAVHPAGGEKFLDFGLLKSLLRAEALPPEDMWFAGEPVKYYYGGHLLASLLTRLTGTDPRFAYNLALAGFYAMLVTAAYGLAGSIAAHRGSPRWLGGVAGAVLVGFASNLVTPVATAVWVLPGGLGEFLADLAGVGGQGLVDGPASFSYWDASRVIDGTINEFPLFAWLNGDLHAHMMSTPFLLLGVGILFSYYLTPAEAVRRRRLLVFGAVPPVAGLLAVVNTWSVPTVGGLTLLALLFAPADPRSLLPGTIADRIRFGTRAREEAARTVTAAGVAAAGLLLCLLWSGPFWFGTASGRELGLFPGRSPFGPLVLVHGLFLTVFVPYLLRHALPHVVDRMRAGVMILLVAVIGVVSRSPAVVLLAPLVGIGWALLRFEDPTTGARWTEHAVASADGGTESAPETETDREPKADEIGDDSGGKVGEAERSTTDGAWRPRPGFETVLLVAGAGLVLLVEFLYVKEQAGPGRLNTVFKTYMQVWVLWGIAAGAALVHLVWQHRPALALSGGRFRPAFRILAVVLIASTSVYGALALTSHFTSDAEIARTDDPTLDATAFVDVRHPGEAPAIRWLDAREGQPTIVSAPGGYRWNPSEGEGASAAASLTGVLTVVGWHHEIGYRGEDAYRQRADDVRTIYTGSPDERAELLAEYDVQYVYLGPAERARYGGPTFADVDGVTVAQESDAATIYRVDHDRLESGS